MWPRLSQSYTSAPSIQWRRRIAATNFENSFVLRLQRNGFRYTGSRRIYSASPLHHEADAKPLVACIGWLGSKQKHFTKYTDLWHKLGHETVTIRPPISSIIVPSLGDRSAQGFLREVYKAQSRRPSRPTVYHIFSNAGFIFLGTMLRMLALQDVSLFRQIAQRPERVHLPQAMRSAVPLSILDSVQGIILDSAPARLTPDIASRGLTAALLGQPAAGIEIRHPHMMGASKAALRPLLGFPPISSRIHEVWQAWHVVAPIRPQLYLSSQADALIPPAEVSLFMKQQAARGVPVSSRIFTDSAHCEHYRVHPVEYHEEVESFLASLVIAR